MNEEARRPRLDQDDEKDIPATGEGSPGWNAEKSQFGVLQDPDYIAVKARQAAALEDAKKSVTQPAQDVQGIPTREFTQFDTSSNSDMGNLAQGRRSGAVDILEGVRAICEEYGIPMSDVVAGVSPEMPSRKQTISRWMSQMTIDEVFEFIDVLRQDLIVRVREESEIQSQKALDEQNRLARISGIYNTLINR